MPQGSRLSRVSRPSGTLRDTMGAETVHLRLKEVHLAVPRAPQELADGLARLATPAGELSSVSGKFNLGATALGYILE